MRRPIVAKEDRVIDVPKAVKNMTTITTVFMIVSVVVTALSFWLMAGALKLNSALSEYTETIAENFDNTKEMALTAAELQALYQVYGLNQDDVDYDLCYDVALAAFLQATGDKWGGYLPPSYAQDYLDDQQETLVGIGVQMTHEEDIGLYVSRVYENSPAAKGGVMIGDYITHCNGVYIEDIEYDDFVSSIQGDVGTDLVITVLRENKSIDIPMVREQIDTLSVNYKILDNNIAYIEISAFTAYTDEEFISCMNELKKMNCDGYLIDLRGNSGGLLETVVAMLDYMVPKGVLIKTEGKTDDSYSQYNSDSSEFPSNNIVVVVDDSTASASELFGQTLKDYGKAKVVGSHTCGKGTVVSEYHLSNGGIAVISTAKYTTMSGRCPEDIGVELDYEVDLSEEDYKIKYKLDIADDEQLQKAIEILTENT